MVSSVFSDLDSTRLSVIPAAPALVSLSEPDLAEAICRWRHPAEPHLAPLSPAASRAAQRLVSLVMELRSHTGGWPADLPQTPENLAPYICEEVDELAQALSQSPVAANLVGSDGPIAAQPQLLETLFAPLLWNIASSGYEIMRLLEGVYGRLQGPQGSLGRGIVRLVPVLSLITEHHLWSVDVVTQRPPQHDWLDRDWVVQFTDGDLEGSPHPVWEWLAEVGQRVSQRSGSQAAKLLTGQEVEALCPGTAWLTGSLCLSFHLVMEAANTAMAAEEAFPPARLEPASPADFQPSAAAFSDTDLITFLNLFPEPPASAASEPFTLDDFAQTLEQDTPNWAVSGWDGLADPLLLPEADTQEPWVLLPRSGAPSSEDAIAAWVTMTDEAWIQAFLQAVAQDILSQRLGDLLAHPSELALVQAAYEATNAVQGPDGLFKHTFVHQPMLLADLWPRLRWYLTAASPRVMELMGGLEAQWLSPGLPWQRGALYLQPVLALQREAPDWWLDLATGQVLWSLPEPIPPDTMISLPALESGLRPQPLATLTHWLETELNQHACALNQLRQGTPIELHRLDADEADQTAFLSLSWQFVLQPGL